MFTFQNYIALEICFFSFLIVTTTSRAAVFHVFDAAPLDLPTSLPPTPSVDDLESIDTGTGHVPSTTTQAPTLYSTQRVGGMSDGLATLPTGNVHSLIHSLSYFLDSSIFITVETLFCF